MPLRAKGRVDRWQRTQPAQARFVGRSPRAVTVAEHSGVSVAGPITSPLISSSEVAATVPRGIVAGRIGLGERPAGAWGDRFFAGAQDDKE
jgi:hypothetical protein